MKTTPQTLQTFAIALRWEKRYRTGEYLTGQGAFCPALETPDGDFAAALRQYRPAGGTLLEIGTGLGFQAIHHAQAGFRVTATDVADTAVKLARENAARHGLNAPTLAFVTDNILNSALRGSFDVVADRGCLATLKDWEVDDYARSVRRLIHDDGLFLLKLNAGQNALINALLPYFHLEYTHPTFYQGSQAQGLPALFFVLTPLPQENT